MQKNTGLKRILFAMRYSWQGLRAAYHHEAAFRQECWAAAVLIPLTYWLDVSPVETVLLLGSVLMVLVVELLNSAIEALTDRIGTEQNPLSGRAKDMGSAAVMLAILIAAFVWVTILWPDY